jgi:hypothetical protein
MAVRWIVFSRNRAYQLYALLETALTNGGVKPGEIAVLTRYDAEHQASLDIVRTVFANCRWIARTDFERDVRAALDWAGETVAFATDDSLFTRRVDWDTGELAIGDGVGAFSHRLGLHLRRCYPTDSEQPVPADLWFQGHYLAWTYRQAAGDWGCLGSIDATQFRKSDLERWIIGATTPNHLEDVLNARIKGSLAACGPLASYFTNPINVVQHTHANRHGGGSADVLLERFMAGQRPNVSGVAGLLNVSCHQEVEI